MKEITKEYTNGEVTVVWKPKTCFHSEVCVRTLPKVYRPEERPWIRIEKASTEELIDQIDRCPSGALSYYMNAENNKKSDALETIIDVPETNQRVGNSNEAHVIRYLNEQRTITVNPGETILDASLKENIDHTHTCGGKARCSSCRVVVETGIENCVPRNEQEAVVANKLAFSTEVRLACQTTLLGDISLSKPELDPTDIEIASLTIAEVGENKIGEEKELTILFADIEGYTSFTEDRTGL